MEALAAAHNRSLQLEGLPWVKKATAQTEQQESRIRPDSSNRQSAESEIGESSVDILHLTELVLVVRHTLGTVETLSDDAILGGPKLIGAVTLDLDRADVASTSNLKHYLGNKVQQPYADLAALSAMLPQSRS